MAFARNCPFNFAKNCPEHEVGAFENASPVTTHRRIKKYR